MAIIAKTPPNIWKADVRKCGWPATIRNKRDAADCSRRTREEGVRDGHVQRASGER